MVWAIVSFSPESRKLASCGGGERERENTRDISPDFLRSVFSHPSCHGKKRRRKSRRGNPIIGMSFTAKPYHNTCGNYPISFANAFFYFRYFNSGVVGREFLPAQAVIKCSIPTCSSLVAAVGRDSQWLREQKEGEKEEAIKIAPCCEDNDQRRRRRERG